MKTTQIILLILAFLIQQAGYSQGTPKTITIDVSRTDSLNISQIAEVKAIPLNFLHKDKPNVRKVIVAPNYLYVSIGEGMSRDIEVYQVKRDGTLIRQVGLKSDDSKEFLKANAIAYLENTSELATVYENRIAIFDANGKLTRKVEYTPSAGPNLLFNNKIWNMSFKLEPENSRVVYNLISKDLTTLRKDTLFKYNYHTSTILNRGFASSSFSVADNKFYFTSNYEMALMSVNVKNQVEKPYRFDFKNLDGNSVDPIGGTLIMFNKYIHYSFRIHPKKSYCFFL